jgi:hypothetical protein
VACAARTTDKGNVRVYDSHIHSFITKIWLEEPAEGARRAKWRGLITHVPSGERRYLEDLDDIKTVILPYLRDMGVRLGLASHLRLWWRRWQDPRAVPGRERMRKTTSEDNR